MSKENLYEILGVDPECSQSDIKIAFHSAAKACHPDLHPGDKSCEAQFKKLNAAYEILSNPEKRAEYNAREGFSAVDDIFRYNSVFSDVLKDMNFTGGSFKPKKRNPSNGADIATSITLSMREAYEGCRTNVKIDRFTACPDCKGYGFIGSGVCPTCSGKCGERRLQRFNLRMPAGVIDGRASILEGKGDDGKNGGISGNLILNVHVESDDTFDFKEDMLHCTVLINYVVATLGGTIKVPTMEGECTHSIPPGTQSGSVIKIKGYGFPRPNNQGYGDLCVTLIVDIPRNLTRTQHQKLLEFKDAMEW